MSSRHCEPWSPPSASACASLHASVQRAHPATLDSAEFAGTLTGLLAPFATLHRWLVNQVTT
jgi:hypothetical protein